MKPNKLLLKISKIFGFNKKSEHIDNINIIYIPSLYIDLLNELVVKDIKKQIYDKLESDPKLKRCCKNAGVLYVTFPDHSMNSVYYNNGILYWSFTEMVKYRRDLNFDILGI